MSARVSIGATVVMLVLGGCTTQSSLTRAGVQVERDQFSSTITVVGPADSVNPYGGIYREWALKSTVDRKTHAAVTRLYVDIDYSSSSRRYVAAADDAGSGLTIDTIRSQVGTCFGSGVCSREELLGVELDVGKLRSHVQDGYAVTLSAKSGDSLTVMVSPAQIHAQLAALAKLGALPRLPQPTARNQ